MKFENIKVLNFEGAFKGMRNPKESWDFSDSIFTTNADISKFLKDWRDTPEDKKGRIKLNNGESLEDWVYRNGSYLRKTSPLENYAYIGPKDLKLAQTLIRAGSEHRKFMRQIIVSVDITAPLYWWKEFDTYKVGTVANSTSTMHKIASKPITMECFEIDDYCGASLVYDDISLDWDVKDFIEKLEWLRQKYLETKDKRYWKELIRWLPESWLQTRTVTMTYENLFAMCGRGQRRFHKLNEWSGIDDSTLENFISMARQLPYAQELIFIDELFESKTEEEENLIELGKQFKELLKEISNIEEPTFENYYNVLKKFCN